MLDKKISLSGFELDASEQLKVNEIMEKYLQKIEEKLQDFQEIKLRMKKSAHGKAFLHEVEGDIIINGKILTSKSIEYNLYTALSDVFEKLLVELEHIKRKNNEKKI